MASKVRKISVLLVYAYFIAVIVYALYPKSYEDDKFVNVEYSAGTVIINRGDYANH